VNKASSHTLSIHTFRQAVAKNHVRNIWIISYLVVLIIPLLLSLLVFGTSSDLVKRNTETINQLTLSQTSLSVNRIFLDASSIAKQLLAQQEITSLSYASLPLNTYKRENIGKLQGKIREQTAYSSYIRNIYIYFDRLKLCSSSKGMMSRDWFYSQLDSGYGVNAESLQVWSDTRNSYKMRILPCGTDGKSQGVALIATNSGSLGNGGVICMVVLSSNIFLDLLGGEDDYQHIFIMDDVTGGYLCRTGSADIAESYFSRTDEDSAEAFIVSGETYTPRALSSKSEGLRIVSVMPIAQYSSQLRGIQTIYFIFLCVCLLFGLLISVLFATRNYAPVKKLSSLVDSQNYKRESSNEFDYLESSFSDLIAVKQFYEKELTGHKLALRQINLRRMLQGTIHSRQAFEFACADYRIDFSTDFYCLIAVKVLDYAVSLSDDKPEDTAMNRPAYSACSSALTGLLSNAFDFYFCVEDDILYAICSCMQVPEDRQTVTAELTEGCRGTGDMLKRRDGLELLFYISDIYSDRNNPVNSIHKAYEEALWGFEQSEAFSMEQSTLSHVSVNQSISAISSSHTTNLPDSIQRQHLMKYIVKSKTEDAKLLLPQIMTGGIAHLSRDFSYIRMHCIYLTDYIVSNMEDGQARVLGDEIKILLSSILNTQNIKELTKTMEDAVEFFIAAFMEDSAGKSGNALYLEIVDYIDQNFKDPNLTVASLTEHFGMSQSYLLRVFKKDSGSGILDYIHQRRVDESKLLLKNTGKTIAEIAAAIGYSNQLALIRAFKRLEGITPSEYRSLN